MQSWFLAAEAVSKEGIRKVDFEESRKSSRTLDVPYKSLAGDEIWQLYVDLYEKHMPKELVRQEHTRIPKIIHQIWLGSPLPDYFKKWQQSWIKLNPNFEYRLWTDADVDQVLSPRHKEIFDSHTNMGNDQIFFVMKFLISMAACT